MKYATRLTLFYVAIVCAALPVRGAVVRVLPMEGSKAVYDELEGEIVAFTDQEIRLMTLEEPGEKVLSLSKVLSIQFRPQPIVAESETPVPYQEVRLMDGSRIRCQAINFRGRQAELRLFNGQAVQFPVEMLESFLMDAHEEQNQKDFAAAESKRQDILRLLSKDGASIDHYEGFVGDATDDGAALRFKRGRRDHQVTMDRVKGVQFNRPNSPKLSPAIGKLSDHLSAVSTWAIESFEVSASSIRIRTPAGIELELPTDAVARLDLSPGKLVYLSDMEPISVLETPLLARLWRYRRDTNLEGGPISLGLKSYSKGLAVHSQAELEYDVAGYNFFRCTLGIDDLVTGSGHAIVRIEGDGEVLFSSPVTSSTGPLDVNVPIKDVQRLKLIVEYGEGFDLGDHIDFADARVTK